MNCEQAKQIPLVDLLEKLGRQSEKVKANEAWFKSPFRNERTASLKVDLKHNLWIDFGTGKGGTGIDLIIEHLKCTGEDYTVHDALRWIKNMTGGISISKHFADQTEMLESVHEKGWRLISETEIKELALIRYLEKRGIPIEIGSAYLKEVRIAHKQTNSRMYLLGLKNDDGGFELRNMFIQTCLAPKAVTCIRGNGEAVHVFEGLMDWLSILAQRDGQPLEEDVIVLNSLSNLRMCLGYLVNYPYKKVYSWLDNDKAGEASAKELNEFCKTQVGLTFSRMNKQYLPHKDVNAAHMFELGLQPI